MHKVPHSTISPKRVQGGVMRSICRIAFYFLVVLFACQVVSAQTYEGRMLGTVLDSTGATVPGAKVQIANVDNGVSRNLESNEAGEYVAPNLQPGLYAITVQAPGFK